MRSILLLILAFFLFCLYNVAFLSFLTSVCEEQLRFCVNVPNEPEKVIRLKQNNNHKNSILQIFVSQFFEMHNLYIIWFYASQFFRCKIRLDAFSLLYSNLFLAKLCLFVFGDTFAASHSQFIGICSCFFCD